jgi:hypothetical protein
MKRRDIRKIARLSIAAVLACGAAIGDESVPDVLKAPANQKLSLSVQATGVQIYECKAAKDDATRFEWVLKAPEAVLLDNSGKRIGRHYVGPTWESDDGSKVVGEVKAKDNGPEANAIPWLLLAAKSTSGKGVFGKTLSIQRVNTFGGKAPPEGCDQSQLGKELRVDYKATYRFYTANEEEVSNPY